MKCIFCDIVQKTASAEILYEDHYILSFLDINPFNYGHTLVIPKFHYDNFLDVPEEQINGMFSVIKKMTGGIISGLHADGYNILSNNGKAAGQSVFHCHFHIIPRFASDGYKFKMELKKYGNNDMGVIAQKIKSSIFD